MNRKLSSLLVGYVSALTYVSWFVSFTPPSEPHTFPEPKPSNILKSVLYRTCPWTGADGR